ncbi:MAG: hypothetical protein K8R60_17730 [Burkholderiales bacterium]|nr:hypothetical protein [Burkholderiales bacterium]
MRSKWADRLLLVGAAGLIFGAVVALAQYLSRPSEWAQQLSEANPAWDVARSASRGSGWLDVTEKASGARLMIPEGEGGPYAMARVPCAEMTKAAPPWFRVPPDASDAPALPCVRLTAPGRDVWITNFRTTLEVPEIWEDFYEPLIRDYPYGGSGGGSWAAASDASRHANVISYGVSPYDASDRRETHLAAFYVDGRATVVVTFRDVAP